MDTSSTLDLFKMNVFSELGWKEKKVIVSTFTTIPGTGKSKIIEYLVKGMEKAYWVDGDGKELFGNAKKKADVLTITSSKGDVIKQTLYQFMKTVEDESVVFIDKNIHRPQSFEGQLGKFGVPVFWLPFRLSPARIYNDPSVLSENKDNMLRFIGDVIMERAIKEPRHSLRPDDLGKTIEILKGHMKNQKGLKFPRLVEIDVLEGFNKFRNIDHIIKEIVSNLNVPEILVPVGMGGAEPFQVRLFPRDQEEFWQTLEKSLPDDSLHKLKRKGEFHVTVSFKRFIFHLLTKDGEKVHTSKIREITITHILLKKEKFLVCFGNDFYQFTGAPLHLTMALGDRVQAVTTGERVGKYLDNGVVEEDDTLIVLERPQTFPVEVVVVGCSNEVMKSFGLDTCQEMDMDWSQMTLQEAYDYLYIHPMVKSTKSPFPYDSKHIIVNMKVFARGRPDDEIYQTNPGLLALLPRGCTWLIKDDKVVKRIATGIPKFFGGKSGDDDESEQGCLEEFPNSKLLQVWGSRKANGENGQISLMKLEGKFYWVVGSKNMKLILPMNYGFQHLSYDDRTKYAAMIAELWMSVKDRLDPDTLEKLLDRTLVFEMEHIDSQHIVLLKRSVLFLITVLDNETIKPHQALYDTMVSKYVEGLERKEYEVSSWEEFWNVIGKMRTEEQLEGDVMEMTIQFEDGNASTMRFKFKTYWYIFLRCLREKLKRYVGQMFDPKSLEKDFHRRIDNLVDGNVLLKDEYVAMCGYASALAVYASKMWYSLSKDDLSAKYPLHIREFNETVGINSYRELTDKNVLKKVMKTVESIDFKVDCPTLYVSFKNVPNAIKLKKEHLGQFGGTFQTDQLNFVSQALQKGWGIIVKEDGFDKSNKREGGVLKALKGNKFKGVEFK